MQQDSRFEDKRVLLTAFSTAKTSESMALYEYLKTHGCNDISTLFWGGDEIAKDIPNDIKKIEINSPKDIKNIDKSKFDIVFRHTSVPPNDVMDAKKVITATQIFFDECEAPIIGITGTKGKGTTSTLIAKMLENAGKKAWLVGNVGLPALSVLPQIQQDKNSVVVYEISSFQLWDLRKSPETAVVLLIEPDHLDVHTSFEDYVDAKKNIAQFQKEGDFITFHPTNQYSQQIADASLAKYKKRYLTPEGAYIKEGKIIIEDVTICGVKEVALPGEHNLQNICAAITATWKYTKDAEAIRKAIIEFHGLEHRLERVKTINGITFYNDSFSSAPAAAIAAIKSFKGPEIVILGGHDKGGDYPSLARALAQQQNIKQALLIGQNKNKIAAELDQSGFSKYMIIETTDFETIIKAAYKMADDGDIVLLSPASASFGMFKNFYERGSQFKKIVNTL